MLRCVFLQRRLARTGQAWFVGLAMLLALPCLGQTGSTTRPAGADPFPPDPLPQYLFFNRAPGAGPDRWHQAHPQRFTALSLHRMAEMLDARDAGSLNLGVAFMFSIIEHDLKTTAESLRALLTAAEQANMPVLIGLDGQNWWETRSDLWNWWDPALPGYDPANRMNVEWTGWGPGHAVKIGWRNWGRQLRVRPAPNIESPRVLAEHWKAYDVLIPIVVEWYRSLPPERRYLLGGVKVGWEASINVNAFYYTNGNALFEQSPKDPSRDPLERDRSQGWTFGQTPLGYAAVSTAGIKRSGTLEKQDIEKVVYRYLQRLARQVADRGVPRHLIFTHQGGNYEPWERHLSFAPAINEYSIPGWSFYSHDPAESGSLGVELAASGREQWAAVEWWRGSETVAGWKDRFLQTIGFRKCRFLCVFNWEAFQQDPKAIQAARELLKSAAASHPASEDAPD